MLLQGLRGGGHMAPCPPLRAPMATRYSSYNIDRVTKLVKGQQFST